MTDAAIAQPEADELPPENFPELVRRSCETIWGMVDKETGRPIVDPQDFIVEDIDYQGADLTNCFHAAYRAGVDVAISTWVKMIPGPSPTDGVHFAVEQLWVHQRLLLAHAILQTEAVKKFEAKLAEYEHLLPKPGSLAARAGAWGSRNGR